MLGPLRATVEPTDDLNAKPCSPESAPAAASQQAGTSSFHDAAAPAPPPAPTSLPILYQDESIVAVSKPSGLLVHRDERNPEAPAVLQIVRDQLGKFLFPVHRLDRATSGILVYAFSRDLAADLQRSLMAETSQKEYLALVRWPGSFPDLGDRWVCDRALHDDKDIPRHAHSEFWLIESFRRCALVGCRIATGRYHQIRRHSNHCGRHILGDTTHGKGRLNELYRIRYGLERLFLHAARLALLHPVSGESLVFEDPLPTELDNVIERLRSEAQQQDVV